MGGILEVDGILFRDKSLIPIWEKVREGERLSFDDGSKLFQSEDFTAIGQMADYVKRRKSGNRVYFVINRHINPTNICALSCMFCDFARKKGDSDAYEMSLEEILGMIDEGVREVHIVGGHHPDWEFERYEEMLRAIHERFPHVQIKAFTAAEIDYFQRRLKIEPEESLSRLKKAGLCLMPGGGAEVFSERLHQLLFPGKANARRWLQIHRLAHQMGIPSNATILYGHIETYEERVRHLLLLRNLQDETGGFLCFVPLKYQPGNTRLVPKSAPPIEDLKMVAVSRLILDNFPHIKAYWVTMGEETASIALNFGADDIDGTIGNERVVHAAGAKSPPSLSKKQILRLIRDAGKIAVERDALYRVLDERG